MQVGNLQAVSNNMSSNLQAVSKITKFRDLVASTYTLLCMSHHLCAWGCCAHVGSGSVKTKRAEVLTAECSCCCVQVGNLQVVAQTITDFRDLVAKAYTGPIAALANVIGQIKTQVNNFLEPFKPIK